MVPPNPEKTQRIWTNFVGLICESGVVQTTPWLRPCQRVRVAVKVVFVYIKNCKVENQTSWCS